MNLLQIARRWPVERLVRAACWLSLVGLGAMVTSIAFPAPIPVISAMSVGHAIGLLGLLCYLAAVIVEMNRDTPDSSRATSEAGVESDRDSATPQLHD
jgi:hypothetical protein